MEGMSSDELSFESTHPQNQNGASLGEQVRNSSDVKLAMSEEGHQQKHAQQFAPLPGLIHPAHLQQQQLSSGDSAFVIQHGGTNIYTPQLNQTIIQSDRVNTQTQFPDHSAETYIVSSQPASNSFHYTSASYGGHAGIFDFSKLISSTNTAFSNVNSIYQNASSSEFTTQLQNQYVTATTAEKLQEKSADDNKNGGDDATSGEDDEDVHQCGRCKQVFQKLQDYVSHKTSKVCKTGKATKALNDAVSPDNQNILVAAAKNTIFRDSFVTLENSGPMEEGKGKSVDIKEGVLPQNKVEEADGPVKKRRGRPPSKTNYTVSNDTTSNKDDEPLADSEMDVDGNLPSKTKRKSRPPRRHNPEGEISSSFSNNASSSQEQVLLTTLDDVSGLPTVENIHKFFSYGRGRSRGRGGKSRHTLHRCLICQLLFPSRITMLEHRRKHTKGFKCSICNEGFFTEEKLERHTTKETHSHPCDQCERLFTGKTALMRHKLLHSDKIHKCMMCSKAFKTARDLRNHTLGMHSETQDFICEVCGKGFSRREKLKRHLMIHAPDRPMFPCPFKNHVGCEKTFYRKDKLTRHLYSHSKVKPFKCDECDKSFARTDNLREHKRSHSGIFRYYCTVCGKGQPGPKKFLQHMLKQHNVENPEIPKPFEEFAPEPLIQQHKAVVDAELAARVARAASNLKKEREKDQNKYRKQDIEGQECLDNNQHHVTLATMGNIALQTVNGASYLQSPAVSTSEHQSRGGNLETLYSINPNSATSPQFQIQTRQVAESVVRQLNESILRENMAREESQGITRHLEGENRLQDTLTRQLESPQLNTDAIRRQISDATQQQDLPHTITVEGEGNIPVSSRGLQLLTQSVLPANLQFTTLLNSDLVAIGEAVIRNPNGIPTMFQQRFGPSQ